MELRPLFSLACYLVLNKAQRYIKEYPKIADVVEHGFQAAGLAYHGTVRVRHPLDILINDIGLDQIKACVKRPLAGLNVAPLLRLSNCSALRHLRSDVLPGFNG